MSPLQALKQQHRLRPLWMNFLYLFCIYMTFIYLPWDIILKPLEQDQEVWFGMLFTGWAAKAGGVLHWLVYGGGAWGFYKMRPWMHPWAAIYTLQIAYSMLIFSFRDTNFLEMLFGLVIVFYFLALAALLWLHSSLFTKSTPSSSADQQVNE